MIDPEALKQLARNLMNTHSFEIGCEECFQQMDHFVEMILDGKDAIQAMPLVQQHLENCQDCHEEFEALLAALQSLT
jgi:hypothetical protein